MNNKQGLYPDNYDAFISYKHQSGFYMAQVIYDKLVQNGYSVFMDKHLKRGEFEQQIKEAVEKTRNFILVLFPKDLDSSNNENDWLRKEAERSGVAGLQQVLFMCLNTRGELLIQEKGKTDTHLQQVMAPERAVW